MNRLGNAAGHQLAVGASTWVLDRPFAETRLQCCRGLLGAGGAKHALGKTCMCVFGVLVTLYYILRTETLLAKALHSRVTPNPLTGGRL